MNDKVIFQDYDEPYRFPFDEYNIIGDTTEIEKIINTCGFINIDIGDITCTLSKETDNYVSTGMAEGVDCVANALKDAMAKLPIEINGIAKLLLNLCISKNTQLSMKVITDLRNFICQLPEDIDVVWGCAFDESLEVGQVKISLIAVNQPSIC